jgi:hypothetical protein
VRSLIENHHQLAYQLAIMHTLVEIQRLYDGNYPISINHFNRSTNKPEFKGFDKGTGESNRKANFCVDGKPLNQKDYPGTILPTSC